MDTLEDDKRFLVSKKTDSWYLAVIITDMSLELQKKIISRKLIQLFKC